jgi:hypothetical protein
MRHAGIFLEYRAASITNRDSLRIQFAMPRVTCLAISRLLILAPPEIAFPCQTDLKFTDAELDV